MPRQDVLRFFKNILLLGLIVVALDRAIGAGLERLFYRQRHGDDATTAYVIEKSREELLVFGSSRASHHYNTRMLAAASGLTAFNAGRDEMTITYTDALLPLIYKRYTPKVLLLEVLPTELSPKDRAVIDQRIATVLLPFAHRYPELQGTIRLAGEGEIWKMRLSSIYAYNSLIGATLQNAYTRFGHQSEAGYEPLYQTVDPATYKQPIWGDFTKVKGVDTGRLHTMEHLIRVTGDHGTRLVVVVSPLYFPHPVAQNESFRAMADLLQQHHIPFYDFSGDKRFLLQPRLFNDDVHLNDSGATVFTRIIADRLTGDGVIPPGRLSP